MFVEIAISIASVFALVYYYITKNYNYWEKKGVIFVKPKFPFGTFQEQFLGQNDAGSISQKFYNHHKQKGLRYFGTFTVRQATLDLIDLDLCKRVLTKDFSHFVSRDMSPVSHEYITKHLFGLEGQEWKDMRTKLTPTFSSGKLRKMFGLMEKCADQLDKHIQEVILDRGEFMVKDLFSRFTIDVIATCAFGLDVNSIEDADHEFYKMGQLIFTPGLLNSVKNNLVLSFPVISRLLKISVFDRKITDMLTDIVRETEVYRKKNNVVRNDFIDLLLKVKANQSLEDHEEDTATAEEKKEGRNANSYETDIKQEHKKQGFTLEEMTAQVFVFLAAGFETAASTMSFCLYELSKNTEVQDGLRREIDEVLSRHEGKICYQAMQEMPYMDQVMNETLRMYASLPFLTRVCTQKYQVPGTDLVLDKGVRVNIPTYAIHHDPEIYPDPYRFDPDRFSELNSKDRHHYAFLPFGEGPRNCIGMRFGKLQVKLGLATILARFQVTPAQDTPTRMEINPHILITTAMTPFKLNIAKRADH